MRYVFLITFLAAATLSGCASLSGKVDSWQGRQSDELIQAWGPPNETQTLPEGRRALVYSRLQTVSGTSQECRVWFFVGSDGRIQSGGGEGALGACNRLLNNKRDGNP